MATKETKTKCHQAVSKAIKSGRLKRGPCIKCGDRYRTLGHHYDYRKPLSVVWMCSPCHSKHHTSKANTSAVITIEGKSYKILNKLTMQNKCSEADIVRAALKAYLK